MPAVNDNQPYYLANIRIWFDYHFEVRFTTVETGEKRIIFFRVDSSNLGKAAKTPIPVIPAQAGIQK